MVSMVEAADLSAETIADGVPMFQSSTGGRITLREPTTLPGWPDLRLMAKK